MEEMLKDMKIPFHTPDLLTLECSPLHLVMECGEIEEDTPVYCTAYTVERMSLFVSNNSLTAIPVRLPGMHRARVAGTLYALTTDQLMKLDKKKRNRLWFERRLTPVYVPNGDEEITSLVKPVWLHVGIPEYWEEQGIVWDHDYYKDKGDYRLAKTFVDNRRLLNNHFRYSEQRVEDIDPPRTTFATDAVYKYITIRNREAIKTGILKQIKRTFVGYFKRS